MQKYKNMLMRMSPALIKIDDRFFYKHSSHIYSINILFVGLSFITFIYIYLSYNFIELLYLLLLSSLFFFVSIYIDKANELMIIYDKLCVCVMFIVGV